MTNLHDDEHRGRPLPRHLIATIRRLHRCGSTVPQIAHAVGVHRDTVRKYVYRYPHGFPDEHNLRPPPGSPPPPST